MKIAIYGQYYKPEDKVYIEELLQALKIHKIEFVIEQNYYLDLKKHINILFYVYTWRRRHNFEGCNLY